jgi:hypothetical protein
VLHDLIISEEFNRVKQLAIKTVLFGLVHGDRVQRSCLTLPQIKDTISVSVDIFEVQLRLDRVQSTSGLGNCLIDRFNDQLFVMTKELA